MGFHAATGLCHDWQVSSGGLVRVHPCNSGDLHSWIASGLEYKRPVPTTLRAALFFPSPWFLCKRDGKFTGSKSSLFVAPFEMLTVTSQTDGVTWSRRCLVVRFSLYRGDLRSLKSLREPAPIYSYDRVRLGDVGYIRSGRFHLLFSAGYPLGERRLGTDVPPTFEPLDVGPIIPSQPRLPGCLRTSSVKETGFDLGASLSVAP